MALIAVFVGIPDFGSRAGQAIMGKMALHFITIG
jgi:hypothetical protein